MLRERRSSASLREKCAPAPLRQHEHVVYRTWRHGVSIDRPSVALKVEPREEPMFTYFGLGLSFYF